MVFNSAIIVGVSLVGIVVWLTIVTALVIRAVSHYNRLSRGITKAGLQEVLDAILRTLGTVRAKTENLEKIVGNLGTDGELHIQRIGIVRFNPFADTGGAQSFTIALLDKKNSGIVMTSLYGRSGNRWYVKEIISGSGKDIALSKEEESAIEKAKHIGQPHHE